MVESRVTEILVALASRRAPRALRLLGGLVLGLAALAIHFALNQLWPGGSRYALVMPAVLISCLAMGQSAGVATLTVGFFGTWFFVLPSRGNPILMTSGEVSSLAMLLVAAGLTIVITEAYRAISRDLARELDTKTLLINELNHRVKNTLATVQALAAQTFPRSDDPHSPRAAFEGRLQALSRAHDILTQTSWSHARIGALIDGAIAPFGMERFQIEGDDFDLTPPKALAIAMALHELATNAVKYGALSTGQGWVQIIVTNDARARRLDWKEIGGPRVEPRTRKGFGSRLLERALAQDVGGQVLLEFPTEGVTCRLSGL